MDFLEFLCYNIVEVCKKPLRYRYRLSAGRHPLSSATSLLTSFATAMRLDPTQRVVAELLTIFLHSFAITLMAIGLALVILSIHTVGTSDKPRSDRISEAPIFSLRSWFAIGKKYGIYVFVAVITIEIFSTALILDPIMVSAYMAGYLMVAVATFLFLAFFVRTLMDLYTQNRGRHANNKLDDIDAIATD